MGGQQAGGAAADYDEIEFECCHRSGRGESLFLAAIII
jgi:hypothetical protein